MTPDKTAVVYVQAADAEPFRRFVVGVADAAYLFGELDEETELALPEPARAGINALGQALAEFNQAVPRQFRPGPEPYRGEIIIEWPAPAGDPRQPMIGCRVAVYDAATGEQIKTVSRADITVHADAAELVTADLVMLTDEQGEPILDGAPVLDNGVIATGVFPFLVAAMRVRAAAPRALPAAPDGGPDGK